MAYDPAIRPACPFGGAVRSTNDTWTYNGTTWTQQSPVSPPLEFGLHGL